MPPFLYVGGDDTCFFSRLRRVGEERGYVETIQSLAHQISGTVFGGAEHRAATMLDEVYAKDARHDRQYRLSRHCRIARIAPSVRDTGWSVPELLSEL